jgi:putative chitobiose transport system permease protein
MTPVALPNTIRPAARKRSVWRSALGWYIVLTLLSLITVLPFLWLLLTSLKGPNDAIFSMPPQILPSDPTLANYGKVWNQLPVWRFFLNSVFVAACTAILNILVSSLAAYPLAKMEFRGREVIFYLLLATLTVPLELTYIASYFLAVRVFNYQNTLYSLILPSVFSAFNIFLLRQAYQSVPNEMIDAGRIDGASELRIWWQILLPMIGPALATVAIFTTVNSWNSLLWPLLMLRSRELYTLPVGLNALRGLFASDFRSIAAGAIMTVIPILLFFILLQRYFIKGLGGAVKG